MRTLAGPRRPRPSPLTAALLGLAVSIGVAHAAPRPSPNEALNSADPASRAGALRVPALPNAATPVGPNPASERKAALALWQQANARVAAFPRGHIDILRWEAAQGGDAAGTVAKAGSGEVVPLAGLIAQALRLRPDLVDGPALSPLDRAQRRSELAEVVREVQGAWLTAIAARARLSRAIDTLENARTGAELGRRMVVAGNWSRMRHLEVIRIETAARQSWLGAQMAEQLAMEHLARRLGLWQLDAIDRLRQQLPVELPAPAALEPPPPAQGPEAAVLEARADLQSERLAALRLPSDAGTAAWETAHSRALQTALGGDGPVSLPVIGDARALDDHRSAHAVQARARLLADAARLRSHAREAWLALNTHHALARLTQDEVLTQQQAVEAEVLQRYNGMFVSTWELLAAARDRLSALDQVTEARLGYWQAEADWRALLAGGRYGRAQGVSKASAGAAGAAKGH
jgi:hypothetical protein